MNFLYQMFFAIKRLMKNIPALISKVGVFVLLIFILGSVFSDTKENSIDEIKVAYVIEDEGELAQFMIDQMTTNDEITKYITFSAEEELELAEEMLAKGEYNALFYLAKDFSKKIQNEESADILVYMTSYADTDASVIKSILNAFLTNMNAEFAIQMIGDQGNEIESGHVCEKIELTKEGPNSMAYYTLAMILMMLFYGADYGNVCVAEEYFGSLGDRFSITPISNGTRFTGRMLGMAIVNFLLGLTVMIVSHFIFKVNWGDQVVLVLVILFEYSLLCTIFGAFLCTLLGNEQKTSGLIQMFALGFTIVSGGFYKGDFKGVEYLSFNHYAKTAITNVIYNSGELTSTWINSSILLGISILLGAVCVVGLKGRRSGNL